MIYCIKYEKAITIAIPARTHTIPPAITMMTCQRTQ